MKITWIGHSCMKIESKGASIIFDPYAKGAVPGYTDISENAGMVICSHEHDDHNGRDCVKIIDEPDVFTIETIDTFHDDKKGALRGSNTISIISDGECRLAHMGDIGCELEPEQIGKLKNLDVVLVPVGGFFTIDGKEAAGLVKSICPKMAIPMHFRDDEAGFGYDVIGTVDDFLGEFEYIDYKGSDSVDTCSYMNGTGKTRICVLKPRNINA